jgi:hypothetical protein
MNCPYCNREIQAMTGLQEIQKFEKHLKKCRKNPFNLVLPDAHGKVVITPLKVLSMRDALDIRAESGQ